MNWALISGGVHSGIGKGCVAAMLGRLAARAGLRTGYQKIEPCLQGDLAALANTNFGEIVVDDQGDAYDGDVARAEFYIPGFEPIPTADVSLGRLLEATLRGGAGVAAPRLDVAGALRAIASDAELVVVELGGTAGEVEHRIVCEGLIRAWGRPVLHAHVTAIVEGIGKRVTSKPAQCSLGSLAIPAELVFVRGPLDDDAHETIERCVGGTVVVESLGQDPAWPERAATRAWLAPRAAALVQQRLGVTLESDPLMAPEAGDAPPAIEVFILHDGAGSEGYASLAHRLRAWSQGRARLHWVEDPRAVVGADAVIRIGERPPSAFGFSPRVPTLSIVPVETSLPPRDRSARPDWHGRAESPEGELAAFLALVVASPRRSSEDPPLAYAVADFADHYLRASDAGALRDHEILDRLVARALPAGERLEHARILDIGCGGGRWAARLIAAGAGAVVGVEPAPPMAAAARARSLPRFDLVESSIEGFEPRGTFDAMLASMSLDHVETVGAVLRRLTPHLKPYGRLLITTEHPLRTAPSDAVRWIQEGEGRVARVRDYGVMGWRTYHWFGHPAPVRVYHRTLEDWVGLLRGAGLDLIAVHEPTADSTRDAGNPRFWLLVGERPGRRRRLVTIDGPAGSGKSSLGRALARRLGWSCVDSGMLQRAYAWRLRDGRADRAVRVIADGGDTRILVGDDELCAELDDEAIGIAAAGLTEDPRIQAEISAKISELAADRCVLVGRSWGREVTDAAARVVLSAPAELRARRRGCSVAELLGRDEADRQRGRLLEPDIDALILDSGRYPVEDLVDRIASLIEARLYADVK